MYKNTVRIQRTVTKQNIITGRNCVTPNTYNLIENSEFLHYLRTITKHNVQVLYSMKLNLFTRSETLKKKNYTHNLDMEYQCNFP